MSLWSLARPLRGLNGLKRLRTEHSLLLYALKMTS